MTWIAPTPDSVGHPLVAGALVGADRPILEDFLAFQRHVLLSKCAGLTGEQLALRPAAPSNLSLLGLVRHMAKVERVWFRIRVAGEDIGPLYDAALGKDHDFEDLDPARAEADFATYLEECRLADAAAADIDFDHTFKGLLGQDHSLRLVYVHVVAEYARHNGHADLIREMLDGATG